MKYILNLDMKFDAAHHLIGYDGECSRVHGHTWRVKVRITTTALNKQGFVIDFKKVKELVNQFDHQDLNAFLPNPTAENITACLFNRIDEYLQLQKSYQPTVVLNFVKVYESPGASITVER